MAHFGELLAELRQDHGLTQDQSTFFKRGSPMGKQSLISSASFSGSLQTVNMRCCSSFRIWIFSIL